MTKYSLSRRSLLSAAGAALLWPVRSHAQDFNPDIIQPAELETLKWAPRTRTIIQKFLEQHQQQSAFDRVGARPYIVVDWDNTAIVGNVQLTLFYYMLEHFSFLLPAYSFRTLFSGHISGEALPAPLLTTDKKPLSLQALSEDLLEDYQTLLAQYSHRPHPLPRNELVQNPALQAFRARMAFFHQALIATQGEESAQRWLVSLAAGQTHASILAVSRAAYERELGQSIGTETWNCPQSRPGKAGAVSVTLSQGLRLTPEMADFFQIIQEYGIDPVICTSSFEESTAAFATSTEYGYNLPRALILGARLSSKKSVLQPSAAPGYPFPYDDGKVTLIRTHFVEKRKKNPLMIIAGEDGSAALLKAFPDTPLCCLINRKQTPSMQVFLKKAVAELKTNSPHFLLQGRDENTGEWRPSAASLYLGETTPSLP